MTMCNLVLFGMALKASVAGSDYGHVTFAFEDVSLTELAARSLRSETTTFPVATQSTPLAAIGTSGDKPNAKSGPIAPISCSARLAHRKSDDTDPNQLLEESPHKHVTKTDPSMHISLHKSSFDELRWSHIYKKGNYYETGITEQFRSILANTPKPGMVIDVGMNIGWFTVYSRAMGHKVVGFDPNPIMHTRLCESLELNGWLDDSTVTTFAYGLGEETAVLNMTTGKNPGKASFFEDRMAKRFRKKLEVPVVRLDDVADQQGWMTSDVPIYLWKLDVEGYEYHVLGGAQDLLKSKRVQNIILENSNTDLQQVISMYSTVYHAGYEIKMLSDVNGKPYHPEMVQPLNLFLMQSSPGMMVDDIQESNILLLAKVSCNILWALR